MKASKRVGSEIAAGVVGRRRVGQIPVVVGGGEEFG